MRVPKHFVVDPYNRFSHNIGAMKMHLILVCKLRLASQSLVIDSIIRHLIERERRVLILICWLNFFPLPRQSLGSQSPSLRPWLPKICKGRANQAKLHLSRRKKRAINLASKNLPSPETKRQTTIYRMVITIRSPDCDKLQLIGWVQSNHSRGVDWGVNRELPRWWTSSAVVWLRRWVAMGGYLREKSNA